ncbi:MAG TPA: cell filamentation protein Fic, partial [Burkholderiaceae bacterium]|nr:cell filamentation protein Fic [Burkholderiaceae bacterium]
MPALAAERQDDLIITRGASGAAARAVQRRCMAGELARLAPGIYVREREPQEQAARVREHWVRILGELVPGSVVSYRSAYTAVPSEGLLVLSHPTRFNRTIRLPGMRVALVHGPSALAGDAPLGGGALHLASMERML